MRYCHEQLSCAELWFAPLERAWRSSIRTRSLACLLCGKVFFPIYMQISMGLQKATILPPKTLPDFVTCFSAYCSRESFFLIDTKHVTIATFLLLCFLGYYQAIVSAFHLLNVLAIMKDLLRLAAYNNMNEVYS